MSYCDVDQMEFYDWTEPVARKPHKCCECHREIRKGEKYFEARGKWDGTISTYRQHLDCCEVCMIIRDELDGECIGFGALLEWYGDKWRAVKFGEKGTRFRALMAGILRRRRQAAAEVGNG